MRNQDDEHNLRIRRGGGRIWQSGRIRSWYRPRDSLAHLFRQQFQYGYWRPFVLRKHGQPGSLRQLVPMIFVAACAISALAWPWFSWPLALLLLAYGGYLAFASLQAARGAGDGRLLARLPAVIAAYHLGYGLGSWRGLWDVWRGRGGGAAFARLTR